MLARVRSVYEKFLEAIVIVLMAALAVEVTLGVIFRYAGHALVWYDEIASILLAWITYYGSALAALKREPWGIVQVWMRATSTYGSVLTTLTLDGTISPWRLKFTT